MSPSLVASILPLPGVSDLTGTVGVCLSGGGSRALSCAMGQLRGLRHLGLLDRVSAISSVSGGTWANALFSYLPADISDDDFLGPVILDPSTLTLSQLEQLSDNNLGWVPTRLNPPDLILKLGELKACYGYENSELWQGVIGELVLKDYQLWQADSDGFDTRYLSGTDAYLRSPDGPLARNPELTSDDFITIKRPRPQPIFNTSMFTNDGVDADLLPFETNLLAGVRASFEPGPGRLGAVGGGLLETLAMNSSFQSDAGPGTVNTTLPARAFTLSDIVCASSAAFAQMFEEQYPEFSGLVPRYPYWPIAARTSQPVMTYRFADGGSLENLGINALLARGVSRLIVFVNTDQGVCRDPASSEVIVSADLPPLFGLQPYVAGQGYVPYSDENPGQGPTRLYRHNQVFDTAAFDSLKQSLLAARRAGGALLVRQQLTVLRNDWFGIQPQPQPVDVLWVYNDFVSSWWDQLPWESRDVLTIESLDDFPLYNTFTQLFLTPTMVNALAHLACWVVASDSTLGNPGGVSNAGMFIDMFD
ncbi:hypothetical protein [Pelomonas cellulosilytica]|uniref:PNPLA domain-containing protein n=1 Tax=Pelomonas cellulosilytica TaxID=2906762 RepID=A0ABS8XPR1_9BURK|nr:hypothetical protein [Pelomonas sp. P8]MCE4554741.1 hypothetical protein [Pelomonas sp. P8]